MDGFYSILNSILTLGAAMVVGFICIKSGYLPKSINTSISKLVVKLTLPVLIAVSLTKIELTREKLINSAIVVICGLVVIGILMLVGYITERIFKNGAKKYVHRCMTAFGNVVFIAYPLINSLYGEEGMFYAALFAFANDCWLWTLGVYSLSGIESKARHGIKNIKKLINPSTIAFAVSFVMMIFGWKFTGAVGEVMNGIGSLTTYLSMIFIGGVIAGADLTNLRKTSPIFVLTLLKMIIIPVLLIFLFKIIPVSETVRGVVVLQAAMPVSTVLVMLCSEYGGDTEYSVIGVLITTALSLITLPLIYYLMTVI